MIAARVRTKRNLRSYYYDTETGILGAAKLMPTYPPVRPRRYKYLGQYSAYISKKRLETILLDNYQLKPKKIKDIDNLPF